MVVTTYAAWFPASVLLPDGTAVHRCRVYLTDTGLRVYAARPADGVTPQWESPIDFTTTPTPNLAAWGTGIDVCTDAGLVVVTPGGGCGCGSPLKRWVPSWASTVAAWPKPAVPV
jgi:hypothetical protein